MLSNKMVLGLELLYEISLNNDDFLPLKRVAEKRGVSLSYLEKIGMELNKAGLFTPTKGPGGGYRLTKPLCEIPVGEVIKVMARKSRLIDKTTSNKKVTIERSIYMHLDGLMVADLFE